MDMELDRIFAILLLVIGAYYIVSANTIRRDKKIRPGDTVELDGETIEVVSA